VPTAKKKNPAYQRRFTLSQNNSVIYFTRAVVKPDIERELGKVELPRTLQWRQQQLGRAMSVASQMNRRAAELERFVKQRLRKAHAEHLRIKGTKAPPYPLMLAMEDIEYQRWCYCRQAARRADETASRLEAQLFDRLAQLRKGDQTDLVAAMARAETAEPVEPEPGPESEG
jgi:hypothetical protein